jgi:hypothetical protein|tara:strand:+ start:1201 stop:1386 length:186 start_codon:yes stop_codon:yes gene_type:complete
VKLDAKFDKAIIDEKNVVYSFTIIMDILLESMDYIQAFKHFCIHIQPLEKQGLQILDDEVK